MSQWITENQSAHLRLSAEVDKVLFSGESQFQKIEVAHSLEYGNMLVLDGVFQTSEKEEFVYHEMTLTKCRVIATYNLFKVELEIPSEEKLSSERFSKLLVKITQAESTVSPLEYDQFMARNV